MTTRYVYELYTSDDALLYVGCTRNVNRRFIGHHARPWWPKVARVKADAYPSSYALAVESAVIGLRKPLHNISHVHYEPRPIELRPFLWTLEELASDAGVDPGVIVREVMRGLRVFDLKGKQEQASRLRFEPEVAHRYIAEQAGRALAA